MSPVRDQKGEIVAASRSPGISPTVPASCTREVFLQLSLTHRMTRFFPRIWTAYILSWNKGAERLYGYTEQDMIGKHVSILFPPEQPNETSEILCRLRNGGRIDHYETVRVTKDGTRLDVSVIYLARRGSIRQNYCCLSSCAGHHRPKTGSKRKSAFDCRDETLLK